MKNKQKAAVTFLTLFLVMTQTACWETASVGTVKVQTIWDKPTKVIRGGETVASWNTLWDEYYTIDIRVETEEVEVAASTKDNAALNLKMAVSYIVNTDSDDNVFAYIAGFGLESKTRDERKDKILRGQISTEAKNIISEFDAYSLLANQEQVQKQVFEKLKPLLAANFLKIESVQITGRPDFIDDRIEQSASAVVANQKLKQASEAALEAAKVDAQKKQVEAATYANPALLEIRKLELQKEVAEAWAKHQGTLVLGNNAIQIQDK